MCHLLSLLFELMVWLVIFELFYRRLWAVHFCACNCVISHHRFRCVHMLCYLNDNASCFCLRSTSVPRTGINSLRGTWIPTQRSLPGIFCEKHVQSIDRFHCKLLNVKHAKSRNKNRFWFRISIVLLKVLIRFNLRGPDWIVMSMIIRSPTGSGSPSRRSY